MVIYTKEQKKEPMNLARLKKGGETFEIDVDPDLAIKFRTDDSIDIKDVLMAEKIFVDVKKGLFASEDKMLELFETANPLKVAKIILKHGEIQVTAQHREKLREEKRKRIVNLIHINAIDPKTGFPHPLTRIEAAINEAKVKVDELKSAEEQVDMIVKKLLPIIPIKFDTKKFELEIKQNYAQGCIGIIKGMAKVETQNWGADGSLHAIITIPGGLSEEFFDKLNSITRGTLNSKMVK